MISIRPLYLLLYISFLLVHFGTQAEDDVSLDNIEVKTLTEDWLYYNNKFKSFFPYTNTAKETQSLSQLVELDRYKEYNLNFIAAPELSFFVNDELYYKNNSKEKKIVRIKISDIKYIENGEKEVLTFFQPNGELPLNTFFIGHSIEESSKAKFFNFTGQILPRETNSKENIFIMTFLFILVILAILRNRYPKKFYEFSHFNNIIPSIDDDVIYDLSSSPVLLFVLINSMCSALILFLIHDQFNLNTLDFLNIFQDKPVLGILIAGVSFFLIFIIKFIYLKIIGGIFNLSELVKIQFFELMKVSFKINLFLTIITIIFYCSSYFHIELNYDYFFYFTVISLLIVLMRVGYLAFKLSGFRNIYLFSYLCTTEILPLVIIVKMILF